jgi:hypothetical protein
VKTGEASRGIPFAPLNFTWRDVRFWEVESRWPHSAPVETVPVVIGAARPAITMAVSFVSGSQAIERGNKPNIEA